jgi:hypothetical protein
LVSLDCLILHSASTTHEACRCYGTRYPGGGSAEVWIDGELIGSFDAAGYEQQYPLWSQQNLDPCPHTLEITTKNCPVSSCASCTGQSCPSCFDPCLSIDFFRSVFPERNMSAQFTSFLGSWIHRNLLQTLHSPGALGRTHRTWVQTIWLK